MTLQSWKPDVKNNIDDISSLQWSHDLSVMETSHTSGARWLIACFNGAMTFQSWKRRNPDTFPVE